MTRDPFRNPTKIIPADRNAQIGGGTAGNHTVTGIRTEDSILEVINRPQLTEGTPNTYTTPVDLTSEFSITADDTINNTGGTNTNGGLLIVRWYDHDRGETVNAPWV